jgi:hypothetical protein
MKFLICRDGRIPIHQAEERFMRRLLKTEARGVPVYWAVIDGAVVYWPTPDGDYEIGEEDEGGGRSPRS